MIRIKYVRDKKIEIQYLKMIVPHDILSPIHFLNKE